MRFAGNANFATDHILYVGSDQRSRTAPRAWRTLDGDHQQHMGFIPVVNHRTAAQPDWHRPSYLSRLNPFRQFPLDFRRLAGVPRILPIDVPARIELKQQPDPQGLARRSGSVLRNQADFRVRYRFGWRRCLCLRLCAKEEHGSTHAEDKGNSPPMRLARHHYMSLSLLRGFHVKHRESSTLIVLRRIENAVCCL